MKKTCLITTVALCLFCSFRADYFNSILRPRPVVIANTSLTLLKAMLADTPGELPRSYKQRKFLNDLPGVAENPALIPGNIVKFNAADTSYQVRTSHALIKGGKSPVLNIVTDGVLFSGLVTSKTSFNGSRLIGGLKVKQGEVMELTIKDDAVSTVPDSLVDIDAIKKAAGSLSADELKGMFFVKAAMATTLLYRVYSMAKFDPAKNAYYVTSEGKTYSAAGKAMTANLVSVFLIPLDRIMGNQQK